MLDGVVSGGVAAVAGAGPELAVRIGASMTLLQLGIGVVNDLVDAPADAGRKAGKPIPEGLVGEGAARAAAAVAFGAGLLLAASVGPIQVVLAVVVGAIGLAYDLRLKGTDWSWLPFAVGIPILPVYGWLGATGTLPIGFAVLIPAAVSAGAALAITNSLVDVERDTAAGKSSIAVRLGLWPAARLACVLLAGVTLAALGSAIAATALPVGLGIMAAAGGLAAASAWWSATRAPRLREWAWRLQAGAIAILGLVWVRSVLA